MFGKISDLQGPHSCSFKRLCRELFSGLIRLPGGIVYLQNFQLHQSAERIPGHRGNVIVAEQQVVKMR